uniref:SMG7 nonsense mediated mRNA decay factor n=1 Tax=Tetraodon nigroviridis TaxID=99883 RepID=H3CBL2_TETNG
VSFLGVMCSCELLNKKRGEEQTGVCPLPAIKVSLDWLKLRPGVFQEAALDTRQHVWPWLVSVLNSFQPKEDMTSSAVSPLPEEFELQGFLALRPALRSLDFTKGHQGILEQEDPRGNIRHHRLISLGKWVADNQPGLIQYRMSEAGLVFITDIPEVALEEPSEKEAPVLQESSNSEQTSNEGGNVGLKSVLSVGKTQSSFSDGSERPVVTFKENIKPREQSRDAARNQPLKDGGKERRDFSKGSGAAGKLEPKRDGKRKGELKKAAHDKDSESGKQVKPQAELRKTPVSEVKKTPGTQTQTTCSSQFIPIHHPGAFPPLPSRPGFPPPAYVIPPPVAFPGLQVNPGFTFSPGVSVPGPFLQPGIHTQAGSQTTKQTHIPYSQQRPSGPSPAPGLGQGPCGGTMSQGQPPQAQAPSQPNLQQSVQLLNQQQQSPTKLVQQAAIGKSPPHHPGLQQWNQAPAALSKIPPLQMSIKQTQHPQQTFFMAAQDPLKLYEHQMAPPGQAPLSNVEKKAKFPNVKMPDFYWDPSYQMGDGPSVLSDRMKSPVAACPKQDSSAGPRGPPFENAPVYPSTPEPSSQSASLCPCGGVPAQEFGQSSIFRQGYGKAQPTNAKPSAPTMHQEPSLYSLFPWSPSLPASSDHSTPASQSPHSSNPSSLPSSPPTHSHGAPPFSTFGPIGTPDSRDRRLVDRWKPDKTGPVSTLGLDYLPTSATSASSDSSWHQIGPAGSSWTNQESPMEESSVLLDSLKSIWSSSMMQPGPSALEQLLLQQKQKQQRGHGTMNPPH